jgi:hypothetical protein
MRRKVTPSGTSISTHWLTPDRPQTDARRLLVLLPDGDLNEAGLARVLWRVAGQHCSQAHLIVGIDDWASEGLAQLRVALLESMLREAGIETKSQLVPGDIDWMQTTRQQYVPGDVVVCLAEHKLPVRTHNFGVEVCSLSQHLAVLRMPVCELRGVVIHPPAMTVTRAIKVWMVPLLIIFGSLALEAMFFSWARNWAEWARNGALAIYTTLEVLSVAWLARK